MKRAVYPEKIYAETVNMGKVLPNEVIELRHVLDPEKYRLWLTALENDDSPGVEDILSAADESERDRLLNGTFNFARMPAYLCKGGFLGTVDFHLTRPWCLAAVAGSHNAMKSMLLYKVHVAQKEPKGNNIIHILIHTAFLEPSLEDLMNSTYGFLRDTLSLTDLKELLHDTNEGGYRPIEYAAHLGVFQILQSIFRTEGIYMVKEEINSLYSIEWFNVTEYEKPDKSNRHWCSPLYLLMLVEDDKVSETTTDDIFATSLVQNWTKLKMRTNMPVIILWFLVRIMFLLAFTLVDRLTDGQRPVVVNGEVYTAEDITTMAMTPSDNITFKSNSTVGQELELDCAESHKSTINSTLYGAIVFYLLIHALVVIVYDLIEGCIFMKQMSLLRTPKGLKSPTVNYFFYRVNQFFQAVMILLQQVSVTMSFLLGYGFPPTIFNIIYINITMSLVWSFLFFVQLVPWIGHFVVAVQTMVMKLFKFLFIFCAFTLCFTGTFQRLMSIGRKESECLPEFATFGDSFYTVFTVMLNMIDFRKLSPSDPASVYILHAIYVFMTAILLLNFLIALFSTTFARIDDHKQVLQTVQCLSVSWLIEERMRRWFCPCLYHWMNRKSFPMVKAGEFAVPCVVVCQKSKDKHNIIHGSRPQSAKKKRPIVMYTMR